LKTRIIKNNRRFFIPRTYELEKKEPVNDKPRLTTVILKRIFNSDTIIVALLPILIYSSLYSFNMGYFNYFKIPIKLISFEIPEIFYFLGIVAPIAFIIFYFIIEMVYDDNIRNISPYINWQFLLFIIFNILNSMFVGMLLYSDNIGKFFLIIGISSLVVILCSVLLVFVLYKRAGYKFKLVDSFIEFIFIIYIKDEKKKSFIQKSSFIIFIFSLVILMFNILYFFGSIKAKNQTDFYVANVNQECVVLYFKGDTVICSPFDRAKKELEPIYSLINLSTNPTYQVRYESIGSLKLKPTATQTKIPTTTPSPTNTPVSPTSTVISPVKTKIP
jgi:hypothetical protein